MTTVSDRSKLTLNLFAFIGTIACCAGTVAFGAWRVSRDIAEFKNGISLANTQILTEMNTANAQLVQKLNEASATADRRFSDLERRISDRERNENRYLTLDAAAENALRLALANPGTRVPDPKTPGQFFQVDALPKLAQ